MENNCTRKYAEYTINNGCYIVERSFGTTKTIQQLIKEIITNKEMKKHNCFAEKPVI